MNRLALYRVGIERNPTGWNTGGIVGRHSERVNVKLKQSLDDIVSNFHKGIPNYALCGTEITGAGYQYTPDGVRALLRDIGAYISAGTGRNEWNVGHASYLQMRVENMWMAEVFAEFGIPFFIGSTLSHTWYNQGGRHIGWLGKPGWPGLLDMYPQGLADPLFPKMYDGSPAGIDIHCYTEAGQDSDQPASWVGDMVEWWTRGTPDYEGEWAACPFRDTVFIVGECGGKVGGNPPVREVIESVLCTPANDRVVACFYFCLSDVGLPQSQWYGLYDSSGGEKRAALGDFNYCIAQPYNTEGWASGPLPPTPLPTPTPVPTPTPTPPAGDGGYQQGFLEYYLEHPKIGPATGRLDYWRNGSGDEIARQDTTTGQLEWTKATGRIIHRTED